MAVAAADVAVVHVAVAVAVVPVVTMDVRNTMPMHVTIAFIGGLGNWGIGRRGWGWG